MLYEIFYREGPGEKINSLMVEAGDDIEAIRLLGFYGGKKAVKRIIRLETLGSAEEPTPRRSHMGL